MARLDHGKATFLPGFNSNELELQPANSPSRWRLFIPVFVISFISFVSLSFVPQATYKHVLHQFVGTSERTTSELWLGCSRQDGFPLLYDENSCGPATVCKWQVFPGLVLPGHNFLVEHDVSWAECEQLCLKDGRCKALEYATDRGVVEGNLYPPNTCLLQDWEGDTNVRVAVPNCPNVDFYLKESCDIQILPKSVRSGQSNELPPDQNLCSQRNRAETSLFCFSMVMPGSELELIQQQFSNSVDIFACEGYAVFSPEDFLIGTDGCGPFRSISSPGWKVTKGVLDFAHGVTTDSYLNTGIFIHLWDVVLNGTAIWQHDWIVKVDPDAVFFPDRLKAHIAPYRGSTTYIANCLWAGHPLVFGSIEVYSKMALATYFENMDTCKALLWQGWGEDAYIQNCLDKLGVPSTSDYGLVGDVRCVFRPCSDTSVVAFHPFKNVSSYWGCRLESQQFGTSTPPPPPPPPPQFGSELAGENGIPLPEAAPLDEVAPPQPSPEGPPPQDFSENPWGE